MAENVAGPIDAGALAVPHGKHAVVLALAAQLGLLRAPDRGRGEVFVDAGLKPDVAFGQEWRGAQELAVEPTQRRAAIAGNVARRVKAVAPVQLLLHQAEPHQRLKSGDEDVAVAEVVFVVELDVAQRHRGQSPGVVCPPDRDSARGLGITMRYRTCGPRSNAGSSPPVVTPRARTQPAARRNLRPCARPSGEIRPGNGRQNPRTRPRFRRAWMRPSPAAPPGSLPGRYK